MVRSLGITEISERQTRSNSDTTKPQDERKRENNLLLGEECEYAMNARDTDDLEDAAETAKYNVNKYLNAIYVITKWPRQLYLHCNEYWKAVVTTTGQH